MEEDEYKLFFFFRSSFLHGLRESKPVEVWRLRKAIPRTIPHLTSRQGEGPEVAASRNHVLKKQTQFPAEPLARPAFANWLRPVSRLG